MGMRFRLGSFTFGGSGVRFSKWGRRGGVSVPLGRGRSFGAIRGKGWTWHFGGLGHARSPSRASTQGGGVLLAIILCVCIYIAYKLVWWMFALVGL